MSERGSKSYDPAQTEKRIFRLWEEGGYFRAQPDERPREKRFCMVIPPPNVTGALHLGHALNNTLQDILIRHKRMAGFNTFWLVGTDHAGIATQAVVEKDIRKTEGKNRHDIGREELVRRIWEWKEKFGGRIIEQLKLMGCSCDYSRERFTLDEGCAKAVRETFFKLFRDGLIYRGKRLVNWDTQLQTAVADDEVYHEQVKGHFYHFKYPIIAARNAEPLPSGSGETSKSAALSDASPALPYGRGSDQEPTHVHIATTRPETMLADTAVAVHPDPAGALDKAEKEARAKLAEAAEKEKAEIQARIDDIAERRRALLPTLLKLRDMAKAGRKVMLPLVDREIPLICDEWADPTLGTGCVKITPAHDANDYDVYKRQPEIGIINVMTPDGRVNENGGPYKGMKFEEARKAVVVDLEKLGLVEKIEDRLIDLGHSDRSKTPIEPYLSDQWFVRMGDLSAEDVARIQTPFLREYIERAKTEPRQSGSAEATFERRAALPDSRGSDQSFPGLAQMAIDAVKRGDVKFHPLRYENTYVDWLSEKRDWCISRQLWWGHRIPVWKITLAPHAIFATTATQAYNRRSESKDALQSRLDVLAKKRGCIGALSVVFFEHDDPSIFFVCSKSLLSDNILAEINAQHTARHVASGEVTHAPPANPYSPNTSAFAAFSRLRSDINVGGITQDPDVLDTWFSSALWPHSTLGWPDAQSEPRPSGSGHLSNESGRPVANSPLPNGRGSDSLLGYYYPTNVLSTAREIITLWVARMVITGLYNVGEVPFSDVVIHSVIQDGQGRKMSKSAGNGVDPVDIIEEYGADALRFTLADLATETQDIRLPVKAKKLPDGRTINISEKFEKGRNFCNKLWQAATGFVMRNLDGYAPKPLDPAMLRLEDRWILSRMTAAQADLDEALANYRFSEAAGVVYRFMWDEYCSWYIEMVKGRLSEPFNEPRASASGHDAHGGPLARARGSLNAHGSTSERGSDARGESAHDLSATHADRQTGQQVLVFVLDRLLRMLHPFVPFVTEAIWQELGRAAPRRGLTELFDAESALVAAQWPEAENRLRNSEIETRMASLQTLIKSIRDIRADVNDYRSKAKQPSLRGLENVVVRADEATCRLIEAHQSFVATLAGCVELEVGTSLAKPAGAMSRMNGRMEVYAPVATYVDLAEVRRAEAAKLEDLRKQLAREQERMADADFVGRADPAVVAQCRERAADFSSRIAVIENHLAEMDETR